MSAGFRTTAFTLIAISPLLVTGLWLIFAEDFAFFTYRAGIGDTRRNSDLDRKKLSKRDKAIREWKSSVSSDALTSFAIICLLALLVVISLWYFAKIVLLWALATSFVLVMRHRRQEYREHRRFLASVEAELPQLVQLVSLLISSGLTPLRSLELVGERSNSLLANEFRRVISDLGAGKSAPEALDALMQRVDTQGIRRFVTNLLIAMERGAPLVPVMMSLVRDFHSATKTELMKKAGRAEIGLMIPVVFLLLPISVLFTLLPSMLQLQLFFT